MIIIQVEKQAEVHFIPFEVKRDMVLAPLGRCTLAPEQKQHLDDALSTTGHEVSDWTKSSTLLQG